MKENKNAVVKGCNLSSGNIQRINDIIYDLGNIDRDKITSKASLKNDLFFDSLDLVELTMVLERDFRIHITDNEIESMKTVADVYRTVYNKLAGT